MNKKTFLNVALLFGAVAVQSADYSQPNIIFILADDWGWTDWQMNGSKYGSDLYETPCLNAMARQGLVFTQAYATPLSSPSRTALLTGKYPAARLHMHQAITGASVSNPVVPAEEKPARKTCFPQSLNHLPLEEITIAEELKRAGYKTFHFGKWHLGGKEYYPKQQGFDEQFAVGGAAPGPGGYFAPYRGMENVTALREGEYITERLTDEVCKTISSRKDKAFFIYMAHYNVHSPYQGRPDLVEKYRKKIKDTNPIRHTHPVMAAMVESLDASVGKVLDRVKEEGLEDNTIVIVMGDNGGVNWAGDRANPNLKVTSNTPLRGGKCCFYEGGVRVPLIIWAPSYVKGHREEDTPVHLVDFYPTLVEIAGGKVSDGKDVYDGVSILPLLENFGMPQRPIYCHFPRTAQIDVPVGGSSVRYGDYKLYRLYGFNEDGTDAYELYNLKEDLSETDNLISEQKDIALNMKTMLDEWLKETKALMPHPNPKYDADYKRKK